MPDPAFNAYRDDVADIALAGRVIASHYAEPLVRRCMAGARVTADPQSSTLVESLERGAQFAVLDCARNRAWGYAVASHRVGYIDNDVLD